MKQVKHVHPQASLFTARAGGLTWCYLLMLAGPGAACALDDHQALNPNDGRETAMIATSEDVFALDVQIAADPRMGGNSAPCGTNDGCAGSCASSCASLI